MAAGPPSRSEPPGRHADNVKEEADSSPAHETRTFAPPVGGRRNSHVSFAFFSGAYSRTFV